MSFWQQSSQTSSRGRCKASFDINANFAQVRITYSNLHERLKFLKKISTFYVLKLTFHMLQIILMNRGKKTRQWHVASSYKTIQLLNKKFNI